MKLNAVDKSEINVYVEMKVIEMYREKTYEDWKAKWNLAAAMVAAVMDDDNEAYGKIMSGLSERNRYSVNTAMLKLISINKSSAPKNKTECLKNVYEALDATFPFLLITFAADAFHAWTKANSDDPDKLVYPPEKWMKNRVEHVCSHLEKLCDEIAHEDQKRRAADARRLREDNED